MKSLFTLVILAAGLTWTAHAQNWSTAVNSGGANTQSSTGVAEQMDGSKVVVGTYRGNSLFGTYSLPWVTFSSDPTNSNLNSFIVKYKPNNTIEWATRICSAYGAQISSVSTDNSGNTYVCGMYSDVCTLYDSAHVSSPAGTLYNGVGAAGAARGFIAKYSKTGVLKWFRNGIGAYATDPECMADIKISEDGTTLVATGRIVRTSPIILGGGSVVTGSYLLWLNPATGSSVRAVNFTNDNLTSNPYSTGLCIDHSNNVIVSGKLSGGSYTVKGITNTIPVTSNNSGTATIYAKYNTSGNVSWAKVTNATLNNTISTPSSIIVDDLNDIYISGWVKAHTTTDYYLQFPKSSGYDAVQVVTTSPNHVYVVKLSSGTGYSLWKCFGRRSASGTEVVSLTKGPCDQIFVGINTEGTNPSFTDVASTAQAITSPQQANTMIFKINTNGIFQSANPWAIYNMNSLSRSFISTYGNGKVHCAGSIDVSTTLTGVSGTFSPSGRDVFLASFTDNSAAPILSLNPTNTYCPYQNIPLNASSSAGTAPFTYSWEIWNNSTSSYVSLGTNSTGLFTLTPPVYNPYIYTLWSYQVIVARVSVTNCSGITSSEIRIIIIEGNVSYSQVNEVEVCYSPSVPAPDAVFSVNAVNVGSYTWIYSADNGLNWDYCYNYLPAVFQNNLSATMTVLNPTPSLNGFLFRCIMTGCNTVASEPALLTVIPCTMIAPGDDVRNKQALAGGDGTHAIEWNMYPNPANDLVKFEITSTEQDFSGEWSVIVYDMTGRKIRQQQIRDGKCSVQTNEFTNGNYLCVIKHNQEIVSNKKLIIVH
ncbi:T9SS type A sorting domain-containing protein [Fluviicola sp.]|uniref:T9SS type A sorting domain-containing protein n=1 Tax=Fluviicola sp. TaxID=1917219 RepID=UPI0031D832D9